uniref:Putative secreted protein n=1 Tax=Anopheles triannulatus TaxID=58253 RepID=A0A2M4B7X9_9DIPT
MTAYREYRKSAVSLVVTVGWCVLRVASDVSSIVPPPTGAAGAFEPPRCCSLALPAPLEAPECLWWW